MTKWIVQRYDGPAVGWFTISDEYKTRNEAHKFLSSIKQTPGALYAVTCGGMP